LLGEERKNWSFPMRVKKREEKKGRISKEEQEKNTDVFHGIFQNDSNRRLSRGTSESMIP